MGNLSAGTKDAVGRMSELGFLIFDTLDYMRYTMNRWWMYMNCLQKGKNSTILSHY